MIKILKNLSRTNVTGHLFLVALLIVVVVLIFAIFQLGNAVKTMRVDAILTSAEMDGLIAMNNEYLAAKASLDKIKANQAAYITLVPTRNDVLHNIELLEELARQTGNIQSILIRENPPDLNPSDDKKKKPKAASGLPANLESVDYTLNLEGSFLDFMSYFQLLEKQPFLTSVKNFKLSAVQTGGGPGNEQVNTGSVMAEVEATFYYIKEK